MIMDKTIRYHLLSRTCEETQNTDRFREGGAIESMWRTTSSNKDGLEPLRMTKNLEVSMNQISLYNIQEYNYVEGRFKGEVCMGM